MFLLGMGLATPAGGFLLRNDAARHAIATTGNRIIPVPSTDAADPKQMTATLAHMFGVPMDLATQIHAEAERAGIAPRLAFGLVRTESRFKATAVSRVGAVGLTQLMPRTARWMQPGVKRSELFDSRTNLRIGFRYLHDLIDQYDGDVRLALTAYNRGPGIVDRAIRRGRNPENGYADMVLKDPATLKLSEKIVIEAVGRDAVALVKKSPAKKTVAKKVSAKKKTSVKKASKAKVRKVAAKKPAQKSIRLPKPPQLNIADPV